MLSKGWLTRWLRRCPVSVFGSHVTEKMPTSDQEFDFFFQLDTVHLSEACDLYGSRNTWSCLFWLGPSSSETTILKTSHAAPLTGLEIPRPLRG